jgi:predicted nucleic acid-binding protein
MAPSSCELELEWLLRALDVAPALYRNGTVDFADCLHVALAAQADVLRLCTFDKRAAKVSGA